MMFLRSTVGPCPFSATSPASGLDTPYDYLGTKRVGVREGEVQAEGLVEVEGTRVQDSDVNLPFPEVVCLDQLDSWRQVALCLRKFLS